MSVSGHSLGERPSTRHVRLKKVLVVERDPFWGQAIQTALEQCGYYLNRVSEPWEGRRRAFERAYDLVILGDSLGDGAIHAILEEMMRRPEMPPVLVVGAMKRKPEADAAPVLSMLRRPCTIEDVVDAARALAGSPWDQDG
jgi:DNA-binding response OmpR family regulator